MASKIILVLKNVIFMAINVKMSTVNFEQEGT